MKQGQRWENGIATIWKNRRRLNARAARRMEIFPLGRNNELTKLEKPPENLLNSCRRTHKAIALCYQSDGGIERKAKLK